MASYTLAQKGQILGKVPLFESLAEADLEAIASVSTTRSIDAREELFHKGDEGSQIYVVASGQLKVITTSNEGDDLMFCVVDPGEVIGEVALLANRPRTATVVAIVHSDLVVIDRRDFGSLLRSRPEVAIELLTVLARRLARVSEFVEDTNFLNLPVRLAKKLIDFANLHGERGVGGNGESVLIDIKLSQEEWGDLVGTTRESINKQFRAWGSEGLISLEKGKVVIHKLDEIEKLADCVVI
jgi:CRP-like cAMP-binding protein